MNGLDGFSKFADKYEAQTSIDALDTLFLDVVRELFRYPYVTYGNGAISDTFIYTTVSHDWWAHYAKEKYSRVDPVFAQLPYASTPILWSDCEVEATRRGRLCLEEAREAGLTNGVSLCLRSPGTFHAMSFSGRPDAPTRTELAALNAVADLYHSQRLQLSSDQAEDLLTPAELKYLRWIAEGKSAQDTADICGVSEVAVRKRLGEVYEKTGENGRIRAIVKLVGLGVVRPDWFRPNDQ